MNRDYKVLIFLRLYYDNRITNEELLAEVGTVEEADIFIHNNIDEIIVWLGEKYYLPTLEFRIDIETPDGDILQQ